MFRADTAHPVLSAAALLAVCAGSVSAQPAQDGGPIIVGESRERFKTLEIDRFSAFIDFYSRYRKDRRRQNGQPDRTDIEWIFRESLGLSSRAFIGHRNLIDLTADVSLGWEDTILDSDSLGVSNGHESTIIDAFDVNALVLGEGPAPTNLWARRDESVLNREFAGSINVLTTEVGASVRTLLETAPTTIRYFHRERGQSDQLGLVDSATTQDNFSLLSEWKPADNQRLSLDYSLIFVDEKSGPNSGSSYYRHDATIVHQITFGTDDMSELRSTGRVFDQQGDYARRTLRLQEQLNTQHTENLDSRLDLVAEERRVLSREQRLGRGSIVVRHELYDSLVTSVRAGGSYLESPDDDFTSEQLFGSIVLDYTKQVPFGRFDASVSGSYDRLDDSERGQTITLFDSLQSFNDPFPVVLGRRNIVPGSILVTDLDGFTTYLDGSDYTVRPFPERVELRRVLGGGIADGQSVLVDYDIGPEPASLTTTGVFSSTLRYTIEEGSLQGLSLYGLWRDVRQTIDSTGPPLIPNEIESVRTGVEYRRRPFGLDAEYERHDSTVSPFEATRFKARYNQPLGPRSYLNVYGSYEVLDFWDDGQRLELGRATGELAHNLSNELHVRGRVVYRDEHDNLSGDVIGLEEVLEINWHKRQTTMFVSFRNADLEGDNADTLSQTVTFGLRRLF